MKKSFRVLLIALAVMLSLGAFATMASAADAPKPVATTAPLKDMKAPKAPKIDLKKEVVSGLSEKMEYIVSNSTPSATDAGTALKGKTLAFKDLFAKATGLTSPVSFSVRIKAVSKVSNASDWTTIQIEMPTTAPVVGTLKADGTLATGDIAVDETKEIYVGVTADYEYQTSAKPDKWNKVKIAKGGEFMDLSKLSKKAKETIVVRKKGDAKALKIFGFESDAITLNQRPAKLAKDTFPIDFEKETITSKSKVDWQYTLDKKISIESKFIDMDVADVLDLKKADTGLTGDEAELDMIAGKGTTFQARTQPINLDSGKNITFSSPSLKVKIKGRPKAPKIKYDFEEMKLKGKATYEYLGVTHAVAAELNADDYTGDTAKTWLKFKDKLSEQVLPLPLVDPVVEAKSAVVRQAAIKDKSFSSLATIFALPEYGTAPEVEVDFEAEVVSGSKTMEYAFVATSGETPKTFAKFDKKGNLDLKAKILAETATESDIYLVVREAATSKAVYSAPKELKLPKRPAMPTDFAATDITAGNETIKGGWSTLSVTNPTNIEFTINGEDWFADTEIMAEITGSDKTSVSVKARVKAVAKTSFASATTAAQTFKFSQAKTTATEAAITAGKAKIDAYPGVKISADGTDVDPSDKWVTQTMSDDLTNAIKAAEDLLKVDATKQSELDDAVKKLTNDTDGAIKAFDPQPGKKTS